MEKSEIECELLQEIQDKINVDLDKEITLFLIKNRNKTFVLDDLISELDLESYEDSLYEKYSTLQTSRLEEKESIAESEEVQWHNITEFDNYDGFLKNLSQSQFLTSDILDELLRIPCIDSRQNYWQDLSIKLQECFCCLNYELFFKSLEIHYKMISARNSCVEAYLSLLKASNKLARSNFIEKLDIKNAMTHNRLLICIKVILKTEIFMLNVLNICKEKIIDELTTNFFELFSYVTNEQIIVLHSVSFLDRKATWFEYLCRSPYTSTFFFKKLEKHPTMMQLIFENFLKPFTNFLEGFNDEIDLIFYEHNCFFLCYFFSFHGNVHEFIYRNSLNKEYTFTKIISLTIYAINNHMCLEIRHKLASFITNIFEESHNLLNQEIFEILFIPFENISRDNYLKIINNNAHVFKIVQLIVKMNDRILTNGYLYNRRKYKSLMENREFPVGKRNSNIPQLMIDITILMLKNYINTSERKQTVDEFLVILLDCCGNIYNSHPVFLYNSITEKFVTNLKNFFKVLCNFHSSKKDVDIVLGIFKFFFKYHSSISKLLNDNTFVFTILEKVLSKNLEISNCLIFFNFANEPFFEDELLRHLHFITQSFWLSSLHKYSSYQNIFQPDEELVELFSLVNGFSYCEKLIRMLLSDNRSYTFQRNDLISVSVMLKTCIQDVRDTLDNCIGLLLIRILISNLDGLVVLQTNLNLKDDLFKVYQETRSESESQDTNSNDCGMIRLNILSAFESVGFPSRYSNVCSEIPNSTQSRTRSGRALTKRINPPCDLQKFLLRTRSALHDHTWISQLKKIFIKNCSEDYRVVIVSEILNQFPKNLGKKIPVEWPKDDENLPTLYPEDRIAISLIVKFGLHNQILNIGHRHEENLSLFLKQSRAFLNEKSEEFNGFDWFVGITFLLCAGNLEKCKLFCVNMSQLPSARLIWNKFGEIHDSAWLENFLQHLDVILAENTTIYNTLKMVNLSPVIIVKKWLSHSFYNILEFKEICNFIIFSLIHPLECSLYYMLCLFEHNKDNIRTLTHSPTVENLLNVICLNDFKLESYLSVITEYTTRYRNIIKL